MRNQQVSQSDIEKSKQVEAELNRVSEGIIGIFPWGKYYGLMKGASDAGEGLIKHRICISPDGREIEVAKKIGGKFVKAFIRPVHEMVAKDISHKKYGRVALGVAVSPLFPAIFSVFNLRDQQKARCIEDTPDVFLDAVEYRSQNITWAQKNKLPIIAVSGILAFTALAIGVNYLRNR